MRAIQRFPLRAQSRIAPTYRSKVANVTGDNLAERSKSARAWLRAVFGLLVLASAFLGSGLATCAYRALTPKSLASSTTSELRGTRAIVTAIRDLAVLESASYHMERVIDLRDKQSHFFGLFESQDALLLVAASDVVAGIDLATMRDGDISIDDVKHSARVLLPPPTILSSHLDSERTYVASRNTDALALRAEALETRARQEAERSLRDAAIEAGVLQRARVNAASTIKSLLSSLGFTQVDVTFRQE
ncbi:MAG: hypothetical protein JWN04_5656 [Myxococcaceae bacterium]|nr:hypothetical protein [Myxococcaceae bacterium]